MPVKDDVKTKNAPEEMPTAKPPTELSKQDAPVRENEEPEENQFYVHLSDGSVVKCVESDLPVGAGAGNPHGFWQRGNAVFEVIGIYPAETIVKDEK